jgi:DNA-binding IclR family transcriptional regulator
MPAYTTKTVNDIKRLRNELAAIKRRGWAEDKGETASSILAYATPLSVPFLAGTPASQMDKIKAAAIGAARDLSASIRD